jgi:hypothetical protein
MQNSKMVKYINILDFAIFHLIPSPTIGNILPIIKKILPTVNSCLISLFPESTFVFKNYSLYFVIRNS